MKSAFGYSVPDEPQIRLARPSDVDNVTQLELQCDPYPRPLKVWKDLFKEVSETSKIIVLEVRRRLIGYASYELIEEENGRSYVSIDSLGVSPSERRVGHGSMLLGTAIKWGLHMRADDISILVPEIHCGTGDADDVSAFLAHNGFTASGVIEYEYKSMYGSRVDGFYFTRRL